MSSLWITPRVAVALLFVSASLAVSCGKPSQPPASSSPDVFPAYYEIKIHNANGGEVSARITTPGGQQKFLVIEPPWRSDMYLFTAGEEIRLVAEANDDLGTLLDCQITTITQNDPDGTSISHGGLPRCRLSATAGENPFGPDD
jgi:hypothetical protein